MAKRQQHTNTNCYNSSGAVKTSVNWLWLHIHLLEGDSSGQMTKHGGFLMRRDICFLKYFSFHVLQIMVDHLPVHVGGQIEDPGLLIDLKMTVRYQRPTSITGLAPLTTGKLKF